MTKIANAYRRVTTSVCGAFLIIFTATTTFAADEKLDVNDISILWPVPKTQADIDRLIPADQPTSGSKIWPDDFFLQVVTQAESISVLDAMNKPRKINFQQFMDDYNKVGTWKVAGIRVDPSALGTNPDVMKKYGEIPQLRLIMQPVTIVNGKVNLPDFTAHIVYSFIDRSGGMPQPDRATFKAIVVDLLKIKQDLKARGTTTTGNLTIHPGLAGNSKDMLTALQSLIQKYLNRDRLSGIAFMGVESSDPWIFFSLEKKGNELELASRSTLGGQPAQLVTLLANLRNRAVRPIPVTTNFDEKMKLGVSTAGLFFGDVMDELDNPAVNGVADLKVRHVPDLIANPSRAHFLNTDCVSCHSESRFRKLLSLNDAPKEFRYQVPVGISTVDSGVLPTHKSNFRNFGWFSAGVSEGVATVTMRTANESAAAADYINRQYLNPVAPPQN